MNRNAKKNEMMTANDTSQEAHFELEEAIRLINTTVVAREPMTVAGQVMSSIGRVVSVLTLNEEIELVLKFIDRVTQFTKPEFHQYIDSITDDD